MNPYEKWLGITKGGRRPNYFQLLGVSKKETNKETLRQAAKSQILKLKPYRKGKHAEVCEKLFKRIKRAYSVLSDDGLRAEYLVKLKGNSKPNAPAKSKSKSRSPVKRSAQPESPQHDSPQHDSPQHNSPQHDSPQLGASIPVVSVSRVDSQSEEDSSIPTLRIASEDEEGLSAEEAAIPLAAPVEEPKTWFQSLFSAKNLKIAGLAFAGLAVFSLMTWGLFNFLGSSPSDVAVIPADDYSLGNRVISDAALSLGIAAFKERKFDEARPQLEEALKFAPNLQAKLKIYDYLIPVYSINKDLDQVISSHEYLLDRTVGTEPINEASAQFLYSLLEASDTRKRRSSPQGMASQISARQLSSEIFRIPQPIQNIVLPRFEKRIVETPDHEPSLLFLYLFYSNQLRQNQAKRDNLLVKICAIRESRGEALDPETEAKLVGALTFVGQDEKAATLSRKLADRHVDAKSLPFRLCEAESWSRLGDEEKSMAALSKVAPLVSQTNAKFRIQYLTRAGDVYTHLSKYRPAHDAYTLALKAALNLKTVKAEKILELQSKIKSAGAQAGMAADEVGKTPNEVDKTPDEVGSSNKVGAESSRTANTNPSDATVTLLATRKWKSANFETLMEFADRCLIDGQLADSRLILQKAEEALKKRSGKPKTEDMIRLGEGYQNVGEKQKATDVFLIALKDANEIEQIEILQTNVRNSAGKNGLSALSAEDSKLLEADYKYRARATYLERAQLKGFVDHRIHKLVEAADCWILVGEKENAFGNVEEACSLLDHKDLVRTRKDSSLVRVAKFYTNNDRPDLAVDVYVEAMKKASDSKAVKYYSRIKEICSNSKTSLPELDDSTKLKLDPLNEYRVKAQKQQDSVYKTSNPRISRSRQFYAADNWVRANEKEKALAALEKYQEMVIRDAKDLGEKFDGPCCALAGMYIKLKENDLAIKFFEKAVEAAQHDKTKVRLQGHLDNFKKGIFRLRPSTNL